MSRSGVRPATDEGPRWIRRRPDEAQRRRTLGMALGAGLAVGTVVGVTVLYLSRILVPRERLEPAPRAPRAPSSGREDGGA